MKEKLIIILAALFLSMALLAPSRFASFKNEPLAPFCPFFVDENQDAVCDLLAYELDRSSNFDFHFWPQATILFFLIAISILIQTNKKLKWLRIYVLIFSLFYFGSFWSKICPLASFQSLFLQGQSIVLQIPLFLIFLLPIITALIFGLIFCHFICPLGAFQEIIFRLSRKLPIKIPNLTPRIPKKFLFLSYIILFIIILGTISSGSLFFCKFGPWGQVFGCNSSLFSIILLFITLFASLLIFRPFCLFLCPLGILLKFLAKFRIWKPEK
jgi:hypothetical protein